jgi:hypothetical protein
MLGGLLLEPERFCEVSLSVEDFGISAHRRIYDAMSARVGRRETWDIVLLTDELQKCGNLAGIGGTSYLASLTEGLPRRLPFGEHAQRIKSAARRRKLAMLAEQMRDACDDPNKPPEVIARWIHDETTFFDDGASGTADLVPLSSIEPLPVLWLWEPYLPLGMLSMLSGDPGCGKTFVSLAVAAALSRGEVPASNEASEPASTVYLSRENDPARVVRPRFDLLRGDVSRLYLQGQARPVTLSGISELDSALSSTKAKLLVIDPIQSYLGSDVDMHRSNETRPVLDGLARLAADRGCCILLLRHLAKADTGRAIHRGLGSIDFTGAVRTELLAGSAANDPESRALVMLKSNLGRCAPSLGYRISSAGFEWLGSTDLKVSDMLAAEARCGENAGAEVDDWLRNYLTDGSKAVADVFAEAKQAGWTVWQVRRAKNRIGVKAAQAVGKKSGGWRWSPTPSI